MHYCCRGIPSSLEKKNDGLHILIPHLSSEVPLNRCWLASFLVGSRTALKIFRSELSVSLGFGPPNHCLPYSRRTRLPRIHPPHRSNGVC